MLEFICVWGEPESGRLIDTDTGEDIGARLGGVIGLFGDDKPGILLRLHPTAEDNFRIVIMKP